MSVLTVNLAENSYEIVIERGALVSLGQRCRAVGLKGLAAVISNPTVAALYGTAVQESLEAAGYVVAQVEMPDGEEYKNSTTLNRIYDDLLAVGADRSSFVVALGGGVVGDVAGYAAATWMRGIPFVQVPTTLLAQVDSSVGGKTGIDHPRGKNLIGAFHQPRLVLIDVVTLATLDQRQFRAGLAEVIKYGVVIDLQFFEFIEANSGAILALEPDILIETIMRSCQLKARVVELDEKEADLRAILNYGHTLGHAFEALSGYSGLVHGEAVAIGMVLAARISVAEGLSSQENVARICALISSCGFSLEIPQYDRQQLLNAVAADKKSKNGLITFICNQGIGNYAMTQHTPEELLSLSGLEFAPDEALRRIEPETIEWPIGERLSTLEFDDDDEIIEDLEILEELDVLEEDQAEYDFQDTSLKADAGVPTHHDPLSTGTLAELYVTQGFTHKALEIYRAILDDNPADYITAARVAELEALDVSADIFSQQSDARVPQQGSADNSLTVLEGWLDNIRRIKSCR